MTPTVIILTYNSADSIRQTLQSVRDLTDDIHLIDSGSTDETLAIAQEFRATTYNHAFLNYGDQRNWAISAVTPKHAWQLHLDADERLSDALRNEILALPENGGGQDGFFIKRYLRFMGKVLRHNLAPTWHMRLFRNGMGNCELREYDQHFYCTGKTAQLQGEMIDDIRMALTEWTYRHNRWSDAEVREILSRASTGRITASMSGNIVEKKRAMRGMYDRAPLFLRPFGLFFLRYVISGGWMDGKEGLIFCVLQTLWFRFLVDAKLYEARSSASSIPAA